MKLIIIPLSLIFLSACGGKTNKKETITTDTTKLSTTTTVTNIDTLVIDKNSAVYYSPDSIQLAKWKKEVGEKDFETAADDWSYYMNSSSEYLKTTSIPVEDATGKKVLKFVKADKSVTWVKLDTLSKFWGVYLFTPAKEPRFADIVMMEESYKNYFK